jgi:hypothetical protein
METFGCGRWTRSRAREPGATTMQKQLKVTVEELPLRAVNLRPASYVFIILCKKSNLLQEAIVAAHPVGVEKVGGAGFHFTPEF